MSTSIEEVSAHVERDPRHDEPARAPAAAPPPQDPAAQIEQLLRLQGEREARVCDH